MKKGLVLFCLFALFSTLQAVQHKASESGTTILFSASPQLLLPKEAVHLEKIYLQSREISFLKAQNLILFNQPGTYKISWTGHARSSLPWTLGFSLDGLIIFGNIYTNSLCHGSFETFESSVVLSINAGQTLRLINSSFHPVELTPQKSHPELPDASFILQISLFRPDYNKY